MSQEELYSALTAARDKCVNEAKHCAETAKALEKDMKAHKTAKLNKDKK